ncbi:MAG TPA: cyclic nucleotide-binding domain-containing protein [Gaiellaceae bacterium]|nr:cyclic nucleotide-binding domain-containing protein [Gaiellaceae bacterium]
MRVESSVTAITWLPFAALDALPNMPFGFAVAHYDEPPGERLRDIDALREADAFREANELRAWIEVEGGEIVAHGRGGRGVVAGVGLELGPDQVAFPAVEFPVIRPEPEVGDGYARFMQTVGGRIGLPAPRPVQGEAYFHFGSALAWTTLELVLHADGGADGRLVTASPFPRHSLYDGERRLVGEHGLKDFDGWYQQSFGEATPWGDEDAPEVVAAIEAQLEAELTRIALTLDARLPRRRLDVGETLVEQGEPGCDMFMLLDGLLDVEVDGETVARVGAGAVLGELAVLGDGRRKATLRARRACRVAVLPGDALGGTDLARLALERREAQGEEEGLAS